MTDTLKPLTLTDENFEAEVLKSDVPVLVDFWAPWCGPCRVMNPVVAELAAELDGIAKVGKVSIDEQVDLATRYQVMAVPTLFLFYRGELVEQVSGIATKAALIEKIRALVPTTVTSQ